MIVPGSSFRCGFAIVPVPKLLVIAQVQQPGETQGARMHSAPHRHPSYLPNTPKISVETVGYSHHGAVAPHTLCSIGYDTANPPRPTGRLRHRKIE